jgi:hypothetical protein
MVFEKAAHAPANSRGSVYGPEKHKWDTLGCEHGFSSSERPEEDH